MAPLPFTNQIDDFYQHLKLMKKAEVVAERGHARLAKGDQAGARKALDEADELVERAELLEERWKY